MPNNLFESIYAGNDPRLGGLDPAMFQQLYQQYNGALQQWGPEAANAVLQQQLAGLPQSPAGAGFGGPPSTRGGAPAPVTAGAGSAGGPGGRGGAIPSDFPSTANAGSGGGPGGRGGAIPGQVNVGAGSAGGPGGRGGAIPSNFPSTANAGSVGGPGGRGGLPRAAAAFSPEAPRPGMGDIAAAAAGSAASQIAPNVGAGATGGPSTRGGAIPSNFPSIANAGSGGGPGGRGGAIPSDFPSTANAGSGGGPGGRGGAIPSDFPSTANAGSGGGPGGRGGAIPSDFPSTANAGSGGGPAGRGGAIPSDFPSIANAGSGGGPGGRGGAIPSDFPSIANAGSGGGPGGRGGAIPSDFPSIANAGSTGGPEGRGGPGPTTPYQGDWADQQFDTAVHDWLGTEGAANLLEPGAGAPSAPGGSFWADGSPVSAEDQWMYDRWGPGPYTDEQIHEWLGTAQSQSLLGTGGSNFSDAPSGGVVEAPIKQPGYDPDTFWDNKANAAGGIVPGGDPDLFGMVTGPADRMAEIEPYGGGQSAMLADVSRQRDIIDEQRVMTFADQQRQQQQAQRGLPGSFNARGMLNSGQYNRAEGMQAGAFDRARGRTEMGFQAAENALSEAELEANTGASFGAFQASFEEADRRAKEASNIGGAWY